MVQYAWMRLGEGPVNLPDLAMLVTNYEIISQLNYNITYNCTCNGIVCFSHW